MTKNDVTYITSFGNEKKNFKKHILFYVFTDSVTTFTFNMFVFCTLSVYTFVLKTLFFHVFLHRVFEKT